ncbi:hypothetical protein GQX74_013697 [Glossina fuscipes]|nr:hypothetical protein GQX74_013697 [Glossina fuscipes]
MENGSVIINQQCQLNAKRDIEIENMRLAPSCGLSRRTSNVVHYIQCKSCTGSQKWKEKFKFMEDMKNFLGRKLEQVNIVTTLMLVRCSRAGITRPPRWTHSIAEKQVKRTNTPSLLGELFDYGCDSMFTMFIALSVCISCQLEKYSNWLFFQCFCAIGSFDCSHWQTYISGTFGKIDVTATQLTTINKHLISTVFGSEFWLMQLRYLEWQAHTVPSYFAFDIDLSLAVRYAKVTRSYAKAVKMDSQWLALASCRRNLMRYCAHFSLEKCTHLDLFTIPQPTCNGVNQGTGMNMNSAYEWRHSSSKGFSPNK